METEVRQAVLIIAAGVALGALVAAVVVGLVRLALTGFVEWMERREIAHEAEILRLRRVERATDGPTG